jgi:5-methyltetrahydropteroyltriglutamate--homocysteine methyltransferase
VLLLLALMLPKISLQKGHNSIMISTGNLGYPRIGLHREMKRALESFWNNGMTDKELEEICNAVQITNWNLQKSIGIDHIPCNDFSTYDHVLDTAFMLDAIPDRFREIHFDTGYERYFACARGALNQSGNLVPPLEMTKWFNTNYHYLVPEINKSTQFILHPQRPVKAFELARSVGIATRPVILGPVSFLGLSKSGESNFSPIQKIDQLIPPYKDLLTRLMQLGVEWVQLDEPKLCTDLSDEEVEAFQFMFTEIGDFPKRPKVLLTSYFADQSINDAVYKDFPFEGIHMDLINTRIENFFEVLPIEKVISCGIINGRNIWKSNIEQSIRILESVVDFLNPSEVILSPSCSMLHIPQDIDMEEHLEKSIKEKMAFAKQKLIELNSLREMLTSEESKFQIPGQSKKPNLTDQIHQLPVYLDEIEEYKPCGKQRKSPYTIRKTKQNALFKLPILPATTIGSFPQTKEVRINRSKRARGEISQTEYSDFIENEIKRTIDFQEDLDLDVLVHGEFERNDMVQYFAEMLTGFAFTEHGWVQSFGSRYVRPPIVHSDVLRSKPMSVEWSRFSQSLTKKPVKGMLTGPVTILKWSFIRDDQPEEMTCQQIALAIRDEVLDLEEAGIRIIQIDEPAFREGLPLQKKNWKRYLEWAVDCFKIASGEVKDETQIHTHMCYAEFNEILDAIAEMDADVISIEASRSGMELLNAFREFNYPNDVGPGVYDIHSPEVPVKEEIVSLIEKAVEVIPADRLWINPDCGLKTRQWEEITPALAAMMAAVKSVRSNLIR